MSLHFGVGTGTGVRAVYQSKAREAGQRGLYLRPRPFYGRVQVHRIRPTNTVPGALRLSESPGPQLHTGASGARATFRGGCSRPIDGGCTCAHFSQGPGLLNNN